MRRYILALLLVFGQADGLTTPSPIATIKLDRLIAGDVSDASPVFLSEDTLALLVQSSKPRVAVLRLEGDQMRVLGKVATGYAAGQIFSVSGGRFLLAETRRKYLYSQDLQVLSELAITSLCKQFPRSDVIGEGGPRGRRAFQLTIPPSAIDENTGQLMAVSDEALVYSTSDTIRVVTIEGKTLGSIRANGLNRYPNSIEFAGPGHLYFSLSGDEHISNFEGTSIVRVQPPDGWGFRNGWSADGHRLLFDHYRSNLSLGERVIGVITEALGTVSPEEPNSEVIRVIDVSSGRACLNLESVATLFGKAGSYHADLSPSGGLIAVGTTHEVSVYRLPTVCSNE